MARCVLTTVLLVLRGRIHLPRGHVGQRLYFADGTASTVYRETTVDRRPPQDPVVLAVTFRLRGLNRLYGVPGAVAHALFRRESLLNLPLFAGFPGFVSKLWLGHDGAGAYRGLYQWDGAAQAENYARALWRVLALVSVADSIHYQVLPGLDRDELLRDPAALAGPHPGADWWRPIAPRQSA